MIDGVTVLNQFEVAVETTFSWNNFLIGAIAGLACAFVCAILFGIFENDGLAFITMMCISGVLLPAFFGSLCGLASPDVVKYETQYEIILDDEVSLTEFYNTYDIVEQRGSILVVRERPVK